MLNDILTKLFIGAMAFVMALFIFALAVVLFRHNPIIASFISGAEAIFLKWCFS